MVKINTEYITLGQLLKILDIASSGGMVKHIINELEITVNGVEDNRRGKRLYPGDVVIIDGEKTVIE